MPRTATNIADTRYRWINDALACETGFRANEIRHLTAGDFDLSLDDPFVSLAGTHTKNGKSAQQPLRPELAAQLRPYLATKLPTTPAFNLPKRDSMAEMLRADLKASGIAYKDDSGHVFDFHALRHQFASNLAASGVHPKTAQDLLRHSSISLTMGIYTHSFREDISSAVKNLPDLSTPRPAEQKATGTYDEKCFDHSAQNSALLHAFSCNQVQSGAVNTTKTALTEKRMETGKRSVNSASADDWERLDLNQRRRSPTGLQPVPFGRSGTLPSSIGNTDARQNR